jgi:hypothetical protein
LLGFLMCDERSTSVQSPRISKIGCSVLGRQVLIVKFVHAFPQALELGHLELGNAYVACGLASLQSCHSMETAVEMADV